MGFFTPTANSCQTPVTATGDKFVWRSLLRKLCIWLHCMLWVLISDENFASLVYRNSYSDEVAVERFRPPYTSRAFHHSIMRRNELRHPFSDETPVLAALLKKTIADSMCLSATTQKLTVEPPLSPIVDDYLEISKSKLCEFRIRFPQRLLPLHHLSSQSHAVLSSNQSALPYALGGHLLYTHGWDDLFLRMH